MDLLSTQSSEWSLGYNTAAALCKSSLSLLKQHLMGANYSTPFRAFLLQPTTLGQGHIRILAP